MIRSCRVTVQDMEGVAHTVEVTAESLFEAVAQGLAALRGREWVAGLTQGTIKVSVADVRVEHEVKMTEFTKWLDRAGGSPREMIQRQKVRSIYCVCPSKPRKQFPFPEKPIMFLWRYQSAGENHETNHRLQTTTL